MIKNVLVRLADGREMVYPADAVKVSARGGFLFVAVSVHRSIRCEIINYREVA